MRKLVGGQERSCLPTGREQQPHHHATKRHPESSNNRDTRVELNHARHSESTASQVTNHLSNSMSRSSAQPLARKKKTQYNCTREIFTRYIEWPVRQHEPPVICIPPACRRIRVTYRRDTKKEAVAKSRCEKLVQSGPRTGLIFKHEICVKLKFLLLRSFQPPKEKYVDRYFSKKGLYHLNPPKVGLLAMPTHSTAL